jgi:hypothetical protein
MLTGKHGDIVTEQELTAAFEAAMKGISPGEWGAMRHPESDTLYHEASHRMWARSKRPTIGPWTELEGMAGNA